MVLSVADARQTFAAAVSCSKKTETVPLLDALGRVAAQDVFSTLQVPPSDNSAMDGFAVRASDLAQTPITLNVSQRITAGSQGQPLAAGSAARIFTGAPIPAGADAVVIQENCQFNAQGQADVTVLKAVDAGANVRPAGQDIRIGDRVVERGQRLNAVDLGLLASVGEGSVAVFERVKVAIFSTGNELANPGEALQPGQIYNSNRTMLMALCQQLGFDVFDCGIVEDTLEATKTALSMAAKQADVVLSSGGVSVGDEDHIRPAVEALGELQHWKVQMKPGKPVVLGRIDNTPFLGLPGNPVSSFVVFQLLAVPLMQSLQGSAPSPLQALPVPAAFSKPAVTREEYIRVRINRDSGNAVAQLFDNQSSGVLFSLAWADGLVRQHIGEEIHEGNSVEFLPLVRGLL